MEYYIDVLVEDIPEDIINSSYSYEINSPQDLEACAINENGQWGYIDPYWVPAGKFLICYKIIGNRVYPILENILYII